MANDTMEREVVVDSEAEKLENLREAARAIARAEVSDAVASAMADYAQGTREFERQTGISASVVSRLINGHHAQGCTVATLAQIAMGMDKTLRITIE
jgi:hypothetical protein